MGYGFELNFTGEFPVKESLLSQMIRILQNYGYEYNIHSIGVYSVKSGESVWEEELGDGDGKKVEDVIHRIATECGGEVRLEHQGGPTVTIHIGPCAENRGRQPKLMVLSGDYRLSFWEERSEIISAFPDICRELFELLDPRWASVNFYYDDSPLDEYWFVFLSKQSVDQVGMDTIESLPVADIESLSGGGVVLRTKDDPLEFHSGDTDEIKQILKRLGP